MSLPAFPAYRLLSLNREQHHLICQRQDAFTGLINLGLLDLRDNSISSVNEDAFTGLINLWGLYLDGNSIVSLPTDLFDPLDDSLLYLLLRNNRISSLDEDIFNGLTGLQRLFLGGNSISSLDKDIFDGLASLQYLLLNDNGIDSLDEDIFDSLDEDLTHLYLNNNSIDSLDETIFDDLPGLQHLRLNHNSLTSLPTDLFDPLDESLTQLVLTDNSIASLDADIFDGLTGLEGLDLSCNALTTLDLGATSPFSPFATTLTYLDISGNSFTMNPTVSAVSDQLTAIEKLYISEANTECLPPYSVGLSSLTVSHGVLSPALVNSSYYYYQVRVGHDVSSMTITPTTTDPHAVIEPSIEPRNRSGYAPDKDPNTPALEIDLPDVRNTANWFVRARDGVSTQRYLMHIYRTHPPSTDARLRGLTLSGVALVPVFDSDTLTYTGIVQTGVTATTVTAVPSDPDATVVIKLNGVVDSDGTVGLTVGATGIPDEVTVEVTAEDGVTKRTHTFTVIDPLRPTACSRGELPADTSTTAVIVVPEIVRHGAGRCYSEIDTPGDVDWIGVDLKRGREYQIDVLGAGNAWTEVEGGDPLTLDSPRIRGLYHEDDLGQRLDKTDCSICETGSQDQYLYSMVPVDSSDPDKQYIPPESGRFYIGVRAASAQATGTYAVQVFDLSAPIENAPPEWPKASVSEPSSGDLPTDRTTTGFLGRGDATGRRTPGDTDWFKMELDPETESADVDVRITTDKRVAGSMRFRSLSYESIPSGEQPGASELATGNEFHLSLSGYDGKTVYIEVGVFGYEDEEFDYTLTMLRVARAGLDAPARPQGLTGTVAHDIVSLTWDDPQDATITGYQILRRDRDLHEVGEFLVHVGDAGTATTSYVDREVAPETRYVYRIRARNAAGLSERSEWFGADTPVEPDPALNSPATGAPAISGTTRVGETLTADTSGITDEDGLDNAAFSYQWMLNLGLASADIPGATEAAYTPVTSDEGITIKVRVSFTDDAGNEETVTSAATSAVEPEELEETEEQREPQEPPGRPRGLTGTVDHNAISLTWDDPGDYSITGYQILRRDRAIHATGDFQVHVDDTGSSDTSHTDREVSPESSYVYRIRARNGTGLSGSSSYFRADTPAAPDSPATGAPAISGTAQVGETLTAETSSIADDDGLASATFRFQWLGGGLDIQGAMDSTYILVADNEGQTITVRVSFTDDAGHGETLTSGATAAVVAAEPQEPPAKPRNLEAVVNDDGTVTLTWDDPGDDSITGYQILRRRPREGENTLLVYVDDTGSAAATFTDTDTPAGIRYAYRVKAINGAGLSGRSNYVNVDP